MTHTVAGSGFVWSNSYKPELLHYFQDGFQTGPGVTTNSSVSTSPSCRTIPCNPSGP